MLTEKQLQARRNNAQKCRKYNNYKIENGIAYVELSNTKNTMICDADFWEVIKCHCWCENNSNGYAETTIKKKKVKIQYLILEQKEGYVRDHINHNKLDNRRCNLRYLTKHANSINTKLSKANKSRVKGVRMSKNGKWHAYIFFNGKSKHLGFFENKEDAVNARLTAEEKYHKPVIEKKTF